jgi:hypothetical protein
MPKIINGTRQFRIKETYYSLVDYIRHVKINEYNVKKEVYNVVTNNNILIFIAWLTMLYI